MARAGRIRILLAYSAIYFVWGSTYLAIRYAVETIPPFSMIGWRSVIAGSLLFLWAHLAGAPRPRAGQWVWAFLLGGLLFLTGQGLLAWSETRVPSGISALLIATLPIWMTLLHAMESGRRTLTSGVVSGLLLGFAGTVLLVDPSDLLGGTVVGLFEACVLILAALSWSAGSAYAKRMDLPAHPTQSAGMTLMAGGVLLVIAGLAGGERIDVAALDQRSILAFLYLIVMGSMVAFGSYIWLLRVSSPARVSTYAFVNPAVALVVGAWLGDEALTPRILLAAAVMIAGVALIVTSRHPAGTPAPERKIESECGLAAKECT